MKTETNHTEKKSWETSHDEYRKELQAIRALSPQEKSQRLGFFRLLYIGFTGEKSQQYPDIERQASEIQERFFTERPLRIYCDPILFKPIINSNVCSEVVVEIISKHIEQDLFAEQRL